MSKFLAHTYVMIGQMGGRTLLPLPADRNYASLDRSAHDKESVRALEGTIVSWTAQVAEVLLKNPEQPLLDGKHPGAAPPPRPRAGPRGLSHGSGARTQLTLG